MSRRELDFDTRTRKEVPLASLRQHDLDTRANGSQSISFVDELVSRFKDEADIRRELDKYPIVVTEDLVIVTGRHLAQAANIRLGGADIPVQIISVRFDTLDGDDKLRLLKYAVAADHVKDGRQGLVEADKLHIVQRFVDADRSFEQVLDDLLPIFGSTSKWKIQELFRKAKNIRGQKKLACARQDMDAHKKAGKVPNFSKIAEKWGVKEQDLIKPRQKAHVPMALNALKGKQTLFTKTARTYADLNMTRYRLSQLGTLADSDLKEKRPISAAVLLGIQQHHIAEVKKFLAVQEAALGRMEVRGGAFQQRPLHAAAFAHSIGW